MSIPQILHSFATDKQLTAVAILIAGDLVFGVLAAIKLKQFQFSYISDFLRADVLGKVLPWLAVFAFSKVTSGDAIAGVNFSTISDGAFLMVTAALAGSVLTSLQDLGLPLPQFAAKVGVGRGVAPAKPKTPPAS